MEHAFGLLQLPAFAPKPRAKGIFIGSDRAIPLGLQTDILETHADIIDYAKFVEHAGLASRYSEDWFKRKTGLYKRYNVRTLIGGISFELAVLQNKVSEYFARVKKLGFTGVEVSYDTIPEGSSKERTALISEAKNLGLEVFSEVGRKYPDKPLEANEAIESIKADLDVGVHTVTIEGAETAVLKESNPGVIDAIVKAIGLEKIVFECEPPSPWTNVAIWLMKTFGPGVNLENVDLDQCYKVYGMRQGMTRDTGFAFMTEGKGKIEG